MPEAIPTHVAQTVESVAAIRAQALATVGPHQRGIEWITGKLGRPAAVYVIVILVVVWIGLNVTLKATRGAALDPPPFFWMQGAVSMSALLMTTMVLTSQNRQGKQIEQRAHLDLQVNLAAEAKIAKLIALVEELRRDLPSVPNRNDTVAEEMQEAIDPGKVVSVIEGTFGDRRRK